MSPPCQAATRMEYSSEEQNCAVAYLKILVCQNLYSSEASTLKMKYFKKKTEEYHESHLFLPLILNILVILNSYFQNMKQKCLFLEAFPISE